MAKKPQKKPSKRGFAAMHPDLQRQIATSGGIAVSKNRAHMAQIGAIGGQNSGKQHSRLVNAAKRKESK